PNQSSTGRRFSCLEVAKKAIPTSRSGWLNILKKATKKRALQKRKLRELRGPPSIKTPAALKRKKLERRKQHINQNSKRRGYESFNNCIRYFDGHISFCSSDTIYPRNFDDYRRSCGRRATCKSEGFRHHQKCAP